PRAGAARDEAVAVRRRHAGRHRPRDVRVRLPGVRSRQRHRRTGADLPGLPGQPRERRRGSLCPFGRSVRAAHPAARDRVCRARGDRANTPGRQETPRAAGGGRPVTIGARRIRSRGETMLQPDLCVIGAGSGGLSVAAAAARLGADVVLIEAHRMGGDCLNYGCVPSKALIAAARQAHTLRSGARFGVSNRRPQVSMRDVRDHIRDVIAEIAPNDSVERFTGLGVRVIQAQARFTDRATVVAGEQEIRARRFVVATGSSPAVPPVDGLDAVPYLTNETVFELSELPSRLVVLGGGAIGMELAQAYRRLGSQVVVLEAATPLGRDDPELARFVLDQVEAEGVQVHCGVRVLAVAQEDDRIAVTFVGGVGEQRVQASHILVAAGRTPSVDGLGLEAAGIRYSPTGIAVNRSLRTSNRRVYAIGDV